LYRRGYYYYLMTANLVLRFSWAHRLLGNLEFYNTVLMSVALLEVVRRWQWMFVRFEVELRQRGLLLSEGGALAVSVAKGHGKRDGEQDGGGSGDEGGDGDGAAPWASHGLEGAPRHRASARGSSSGAGSAVPDFGGGGGGSARLHAAAAWARRAGAGGGETAAGGPSKWAAGGPESVSLTPLVLTSGGGQGEQ
jgi:hypothetical protein